MLSKQTGYQRNYESNPYETYGRRKFSLPPSPISLVDERLPLKEPVLGVSINDVQKAYPYKKFSWEVLHDKVGGRSVVIFTRPKLTSVLYPEVGKRNLSFMMRDQTIIDLQTRSEWNSE